MWEIKDGGHLPEVDLRKRITHCSPDSIEIPTATPMFSRSSNTMMLLLELSVNPRWRPPNRQYLYLSCYSATVPLSCWTPKHWGIRWNFIAILCTSWDIHIQSLHTAILESPLPVSSRLVVQHCHQSHCIAGPQHHRYSRWNVDAILCTKLKYTYLKFRGRHRGFSTFGLVVQYSW